MASSSLKVNQALIETEFPEFSQEELQSIRETYNKYDTDKNGKLELFELHQMYEDLGQTKTHAQLRQLIQEVSKNIVIFSRLTPTATEEWTTGSTWPSY